MRAATLRRRATAPHPDDLRARARRRRLRRRRSRRLAATPRAATRAAAPTTDGRAPTESAGGCRRSRPRPPKPRRRAGQAEGEARRRRRPTASGHDELRRVHDRARPEAVAERRGLARLAGEREVLRRHDLPPDRPGLRDPGRRPDRHRQRRSRLLDRRQAAVRRRATRRASSRWPRPADEPAGTAGSQFYVVTGDGRRPAARLRDRRQGRRGRRRRRPDRPARRPERAAHADGRDRVGHASSKARRADDAAYP